MLLANISDAISTLRLNRAIPLGPNVYIRCHILEFTRKKKNIYNKIDQLAKVYKINCLWPIVGHVHQHMHSNITCAYSMYLAGLTVWESHTGGGRGGIYSLSLSSSLCEHIQHCKEREACASKYKSLAGRPISRLERGGNDYCATEGVASLSCYVCMMLYMWATTTGKIITVASLIGEPTLYYTYIH